MSKVVTDPKGSGSDTREMTDATHHIRRRRRAIDRLRTLTTGAAVAGVAGTAGFGVLAAATWSGTPGATSASNLDAGTDGTTTTDSTPDPTTRGSTTDGAARGGAVFGTTPNGGVTLPGTTRIRPAQPGSGRSHATTGGSH